MDARLNVKEGWAVTHEYDHSRGDFGDIEGTLSLISDSDLIHEDKGDVCCSGGGFFVFKEQSKAEQYMESLPGDVRGNSNIEKSYIAFLELELGDDLQDEFFDEELHLWVLAELSSDSKEIVFCDYDDFVCALRASEINFHKIKTIESTMIEKIKTLKHYN